jgi:adenine-specific DNA-methyltransferase
LSANLIAYIRNPYYLIKRSILKVATHSPSQSLNKAYLKQKTGRHQIDKLKSALYRLATRIDNAEKEEHWKNIAGDFMRDVWYHEPYELNTLGNADYAIYTNRNKQKTVEVLIEVKKPSNKVEMFSTERFNVKAFHELIYYYFEERKRNITWDVKHLIITNIHEWYIIDENWFHRYVYDNSRLRKEYENFKLSGKNTDFFYDYIAKPFLEQLDCTLECTYFDLRKYATKSDVQLIPLFKILSPAHLLKESFVNDSNSLDVRFYSELLHIIGLEEMQVGAKKLIRRKTERQEASILENTIIKLVDREVLHQGNLRSGFGDTEEDQYFNIALELCITWINRVLFLKLLEAQLLRYHKNDLAYKFLNIQLIEDYDELSNLFFQVLAERDENRRPHLREKFKAVPYLNSSLFERTELERKTINISDLDNNIKLNLNNSTVLKDGKGKRKIGALRTLEYLFDFLDSYDFGSEGAEQIQEENKNLISASVLGLIFEKINGYKDGSFFTPGVVTMFMSQATLRNCVINKFNAVKNWNCTSINELYNKIEDKKEANEIFNSLRICDPAVGSGHFLVSILNELIRIKADLKILIDNEGKSLRDYHFEVANDELIVTDDEGRIFEYHPSNKESHRVQQTLFHEKQFLIEHCLFGVDINPNSVKICRLRLWIELLKNSYYQAGDNGSRLETLPNIDINILCGNSLVSRYSLDTDITSVLKNTGWTIADYKETVQKYREAKTKVDRQKMDELIIQIKSDFTSYISPNDSKLKKLSKLRGELFNLQQNKLFESVAGTAKHRQSKLKKEIEKLESEITSVKNNKIFENAFEWRFSFPDILDDEGDYIGFDLIIGNPPYGVKFDPLSIKYLESNYDAVGRAKESYIAFIQLAIRLAKPKGIVSYIAPTGWYTGTNFDLARKYFAEYTDPLYISNLPYDVFESAWVDTSIFITQKTIQQNIVPRTDAHELHVKIFNKKDKIDSEKAFERLCSSVTFSDWFHNGRNEFLLVANSKISALIRKIQKKGKPLSEFADIQRGVTPFVLTTEPSHPNSFAAFNGSVRKYLFEKGTPAFVRYDETLAEYKAEKYFKGERILLRELISRKFELQATLVDTPFITNKSMQSILSNGVYEINYLLGALNSALLRWYFLSISQIAQRDDFPKIVLKETRGLPIYPVDPSDQMEMKYYNSIVEHVKQITTLRAKDATANISIQEREIDMAFCKLYGLQEDELSLIEEFGAVS